MQDLFKSGFYLALGRNNFLQNSSKTVWFVNDQIPRKKKDNRKLTHGGQVAIYMQKKKLYNAQINSFIIEA